jgi:carboxypeptidase PM20D1
VGATDARHYAGICDQVFRFQPVVLDPQDLPRFHGVDERVSVENLERAVRVYARLLENAAG